MISRENNFDLIRLIAAMEVAIGHTFSHLDCKLLPSIGFNFPFPGVFCFFVISGFLIASSYERNPSFKKYIRNRLLRIIPALWLAFIFICIVLGYFGYLNNNTFRLPQFLGWGLGQLTIFQFYTPDILRTFGVGTPNGSLWTIPVEFVFYLLLPIIIYLFRKRKNIGLILCSVISILINIFLANYSDGGLIYKLIGCSVFPWLYCFFIGCLLYYNWEKLKKYIEGKALFYVIIYFIFVNVFSGPAYNIHSLSNLIANIILAIMTISLAYTKPKLGSFLHGFDISYGLYVYHMIIVNIFVQLGLKGNIGYAILSLFISILIAIFSWTFVESKALKLK